MRTFRIVMGVFFLLVIWAILMSPAFGEMLNKDGFPEGAPVYSKKDFAFCELKGTKVFYIVQCGVALPFINVNIAFDGRATKQIGFTYFKDNKFQVGYYDKGFAETGVPSGEFVRVETAEEVAKALEEGWAKVKLTKFL